MILPLHFFVRLSDADQYAKARVAVEEAVLRRRQLVEDSPKVFESDHASSLLNFSAHLSDASRRGEALAVIGEAVSIYYPKFFETRLVSSWDDFSFRL